MPEGGYKKFLITDVFDVQNTHSILSSDITPNSGNIPYLSAGEGNNSIAAYIDYDPLFLEKGNVVFIGGKTLTVTYQSRDFFSNDSHNLVLRSKNKIGLNPKCQLFFVGAIKKSLSHKYHWGNSISKAKIHKDLIMLPINKLGEIDYEFMESRIRELMESRIRELMAYLSETGFDDCTLTPEEENALSSFKLGQFSTSNFKVEELFNIVKGKRLTKADMIPGGYNFIGASAQNNGITAKIANAKFLNPAKAITVSYNGTVGETFFQDEPFWASDDINALYPNFTEDDNVTLFFLAPLKKIGKCYSYSQKWTKEILAQNILKVPVNDAGEIDVEFMRNLINATKKTIISKLKDFITREHRAYVEVTRN